MPNSTIAQKIIDIQQRLGAVIPVITDPEINRRNEIPESCDFMFGNPQEMPLPGYSAALQHWATPHNKDWFAYKMNEPTSPGSHCREPPGKRQGIAYQPGDVTLTTGAFSALAISLTSGRRPGRRGDLPQPALVFLRDPHPGGRRQSGARQSGCENLRPDLDAHPGCHHRQDPRHHRQ